jgi:hypothetical protein
VNRRTGDRKRKTVDPRGWVFRTLDEAGEIDPAKLERLFRSVALVFERYESPTVRGILVKAAPGHGDVMVEVRTGDMRRLGFKVRKLSGRPLRLVVTV